MPFLGTRRYPKGPDLKRLEHHRVTASGTEITFSAPAHRHDAIQVQPALAGSINLYDESRFGRYKKNDLAEPASMGLALKDWRFTGLPILDGTGVIGDMTFEVSIENMPEFASLFHPRHLECAIERYIYKAYTAYRIPGECRQNWQLKTINGIEWAGYQSVGYAGFRSAEECYESVWHTPITDQHLLTVRFDQVIRKKRTRLAEIYETIIDRVLNSFEIQLSCDAKSQQEYIRQKFPNERLSGTLLPYEFEEYEVDNEYDLIDEIGAQNNFELPHEEVKKLWETEKKRQRQMKNEARARVIESHLRFKLMEKE
jgi:hypothetical protein